uniref:O-acyltransferase like n=1 Tax=Erpetoichthys calabaricus TaxID=27687 RepID=A0A8C4X4Q0_ERPCA
PALLTSSSQLHPFMHFVDPLIQISGTKPAHVYDAFGKMGSDFTGGNMNRLGSLSECLSADAGDFKGQYCQVILKQGKMEYIVGLCVPSTCKESEVEVLVIIGEKGFLDHFIATISLQNTAPAVLSAQTTGGSYSTLNGIRVLSLLWIISGHTIQIWSMINLDNSNRWKNSVTRNPLNILTIGGPAYLAVDTFLLIGIQPLHLYTVCLCVGLLPVMPKGSFWIFAEMQTENCKRRWWTNLLLINNFFESSEIGGFLPDTPWFLDRPGLSVSLQWISKLAAVWVDGRRPDSSLVFEPRSVSPSFRAHAAYFDYYYVMPNARCAPYVVGILLGVFMKEKKEHLLRTERQAAAGWVSTFILLALLIAVPYFLNDVPNYPSASHSVYQGLHRALWAAAVAWIVLACEEGYGGFVQSFLSLHFWRPLSNISFACYMVHPLIIIGYSMMQETGLQYTAWNLVSFPLYFGVFGIPVCPRRVQ